MTEENVLTFRDTRQSILEEATNLDLPDAVFLIVHYNTRWGKTLDTMITTNILNSIASQYQIEEWQKKSEALLSDAYDMGHAKLRNDSNSEEVISHYRLKHAGFGSISYSKAIDFGMFMAR